LPAHDLRIVPLWIEVGQYGKKAAKLRKNARECLTLVHPAWATGTNVPQRGHARSTYPRC